MADLNMRGGYRVYAGTFPTAEEAVHELDRSACPLAEQLQHSLESLQASNLALAALL